MKKNEIILCALVFALIGFSCSTNSSKIEDTDKLQFDQLASKRWIYNPQMESGKSIIEGTEQSAIKLYENYDSDSTYIQELFVEINNNLLLGSRIYGKWYVKNGIIYKVFLKKWLNTEGTSQLNDTIKSKIIKLTSDSLVVPDKTGKETTLYNSILKRNIVQEVEDGIIGGFFKTDQSVLYFIDNKDVMTLANVNGELQKISMTYIIEQDGRINIENGRLIFNFDKNGDISTSQSGSKVTYIRSK